MSAPSGTISVRLTPELKGRLVAEAQDAGLTQSELLRVIVEAYFSTDRMNSIEIAAVKQGVLRGVAHANKRLSQSLAELLREVTHGAG